MLRNHRLSRIAFTIVGLIVVFLLVQTWRRGLRPLGSDLSSFLDSSRAIVAGADPYRTGAAFPYLYPLFLAFVLIPLSYLPLSLSTPLWFVANMSALFGSIAMTARVSPQVDQENRYWGLPVLGLFILLFAQIQNQFVNSQVNCLVLLCTVLSVRYLLKGRRWLAAFCLAAAISVKPFTLILIIFVFVRREYRVAFGAIAIAAVLCSFPALLLGGRAGATLIDYVHSVIVGGALLSAEPFGHPPRFTLAGFLTYWVPVMAVRPEIKIVCTGIVVGCVLAVGRGTASASGKNTPHLHMLIFGLYLVAMLLVAPMSELHHEIFLIPSVTLLGLTVLGNEGNSAAVAACGLGVFFLLSLAGEFVRTVPFDFLAISTLFCCTAILVRSRISGLQSVA